MTDASRNKPRSLADHEAAARERLPTDVWGFVQGGAGSEVTLRANRTAFDRVGLRPRVLVDVSKPDLGTTVLGMSVSAPIGVAPMAYHQLAHPDGEVATARAASALGVPLVVSMFASRTIADIAAVATAPLWVQLYWLRDRAVVAELIHQAENSGFQAIVLTVDAPRVATRPRDQRSGFTLRPDIRAVNVNPTATRTAVDGVAPIQQHSREQFDSSITWSDLAWLREQSSLPLVLKGIMTREDAELAVAHGVDAVIVSNHGGRQLDTVPACIDALPEVAAAVDGRVPVFVDGGVRHGTDVLKAIALGADVAFVGRPVLHGLATGGADGVVDVLSTLRDELEEAMVLVGRPAISDIDGSSVRHIGWHRPGHRWFDTACED